ncbi:MAG: hypothetical protein ACK48M_08045 [Planctomycetia bacterium]
MQELFAVAVGVALGDAAQLALRPEVVRQQPPRLLEVSGRVRFPFGAAREVAVEECVERGRGRRGARAPRGELGAGEAVVEPVVDLGEPDGRLAVNGLVRHLRGQERLDLEQYRLGDPLGDLSQADRVALAGRADEQDAPAAAGVISDGGHRYLVLAAVV